MTRDILCRATTLKMKPTERTMTTTGSTFNPGDSSVYSPAKRTVLAHTLKCRSHSTASYTAPKSITDVRSATSGVYVLSMVLLLPPAPAALVLLGLAFAALSALSAAAFLLIAVAGPPGGFGDDGRALLEPDVGVLTGEVGRGEDCKVSVS